MRDQNTMQIGSVTYTKSTTTQQLHKHMSMGRCGHMTPWICTHDYDTKTTPHLFCWEGLNLTNTHQQQSAKLMNLPHCQTVPIHQWPFCHMASTAKTIAPSCNHANLMIMHSSLSKGHEK